MRASTHPTVGCEREWGAVRASTHPTGFLTQDPMPGKVKPIRLQFDISRCAMRTFLAVAILVISQALVSASEAATIRLGGDPVMNCDATLEGTIILGDAERLSEFIRVYDLTTRWRFANTTVLCMDSPGGNFSEGIKLGEAIAYDGITTAIGNGARCESACAIAFMYGRVYHPEMRYAPSRQVHPLGVLGFHAPALTVDSGQYTEKSVNNAYKIAISSMEKFVASAQENEIGLSIDLILQMLTTPPDEMKRLETVQDAILWDVPISALGYPSLKRGQILSNACENTMFAQDGVRDPYAEEKNGSRDGSETSSPRNSGWDGEGFIASTRRTRLEITLTSIPSFSAEVPHECQLSLRRSEWTEDGKAKTSDWYVGSVSYFGDTYSISNLYLFSPSTRISDIPFARQASSGDFADILAGTKSSSLLSIPQGSAAKTRKLEEPSADAPSPSPTPSGTLRPASTDDENRLGLDRDTRREIQRRLTLLSFDTKGVDGSFGPNSRSAIQAWQQQRSFPASGFLNEAQKVLLFEDSQDLYDKWRAEEAKKPKKRRVKVCQRGPLGLLVNCRTEWR